MEWNRFYSYFEFAGETNIYFCEYDTGYCIGYTRWRTILRGGHQSEIGLESFRSFFGIGDIVSLLQEEGAILPVFDLKCLERRDAERVWIRISKQAISNRRMTDEKFQYRDPPPQRQPQASR